MKFVMAALGLLGASAIIIGLMVFIGGPDWTARMFAALLEQLTAAEPNSGGLDHFNTDSEMRFHAVYWIGFGVILLQAIGRGRAGVRIAAAALFLFFLGGVGRVLSIIAVGRPDPLFVILMWTELAGPVVVGLVYVIAKRRA